MFSTWKFFHEKRFQISHFLENYESIVRLQGHTIAHVDETYTEIYMKYTDFYNKVNRFLRFDILTSFQRGCMRFLRSYDPSYSYLETL